MLTGSPRVAAGLVSSFPPGMIGLNLEIWDDGLPTECLEHGSTIILYSAAWKSRELLMFLWVFAHITRGALLD